LLSLFKKSYKNMMTLQPTQPQHACIIKRTI